MQQNSTDNPFDNFIDAHVHILPPGRLAGLMRWIHRSLPGHPVDLGIDRDHILSDLENNGCRYFFNMAYPLRPEETGGLNEFNFELTGSITNSAGWGSLHPANGGKRGIVIDCIEKYGFIGMKFHPFVQKFSITDPAMTEVYETLDKLERPLFIHTGFDEFYEMDMPPADVESIAAGYPGMPVVISHMMFPRLKETLGLLDRHPNVWADLTNVPGSIRFMHPPGTPEDIAGSPEASLLREELPRFSGRLLFGSDHPAGMGGYGTIYEDFRALGLPLELYEKIMWYNPMGMVRRYLSGRWD